MKHYEYEINLFADGELPDEESREMFIHLAECSECRNLYSEFILLEKRIKEYHANKVNETISGANTTVRRGDKESRNAHLTDNAVGTSSSQFIKSAGRSGLFYKTAFYISSVAAMLLFFIAINKNQKTTIYTKNEVRVDTIFVAKEKTIVRYIKQAGNSLTPGKKELLEKEANRDYLQYVMNLRSEKVTDADLVQKNNGSKL